MGALYDATPPAVTDGNVGIPRMSSNRNLYVTIRDAAGNERGLNIDASGNLTANITGTVTVGSHAVTNAGTFAVQAAQSGTWNIGSITTLPSLPAGSNNIGDVDVLSLIPGVGATSLGKAEDAAHTTGDTGVMALCVRRDTAATSATTDGDYNPCATDANGALWTTNSAIEGTRLRATLYDSGGNEIVVPTAGLTHYAAAAASTNATSVEASSGTVYHYSLTNTTSTIYYLRMYNLASAPTCSSATGFVESIPIPANTSGGGRERPMNIGQAFTTGIAYCITGGASSTDNTNAATGVLVSILYKP